MTNRLVAGGCFRLRRGQESLARQAAESNHLAALNGSRPEDKFPLPGRPTLESLRRRRMLAYRPSPFALW